MDLSLMQIVQENQKFKIYDLSYKFLNIFN